MLKFKILISPSVFPAFVMLLTSSTVYNLIVLLKFNITFAYQMDLGVGSFVLSNSLVSRQARDITSV